MEISLISNSPLETQKLGGNISDILDFGDTVLLIGELGGGKTTFLSGLARSIGLCEDLASPTFTLINIYDLAEQKRFAHIDLYRLDDINDILNTEIEDYLQDSETLTCIEWGDKISGHIRSDYLLIEFRYIIEEEIDTIDKREIIIKSRGSAYWDGKLAALKAVLKI